MGILIGHRIPLLRVEPCTEAVCAWVWHRRSMYLNPKVLSTTWSLCWQGLGGQDGSSGEHIATRQVLSLVDKQSTTQRHGVLVALIEGTLYCTS
ncbi:hypothetical protein HYQ46_009390 [Verticillium longisporum]|nr:hypothetical protein HYQ46_009390 [Verticillium longisporum]